MPRRPRPLLARTVGVVTAAYCGVLLVSPRLLAGHAGTEYCPHRGDWPFERSEVPDTILGTVSLSTLYSPPCQLVGSTRDQMGYRNDAAGGGGFPGVSHIRRSASERYAFCWLPSRARFPASRCG